MGQISSTDRLDVWRDLIRDHFVALDIAAERDERFAGAVDSADIGLLNVARVRSVAQGFTRTVELVRADDAAYLQVGLLTRGAGHVEQDGREAVLAPGDFAVYETDRPFHWQLHYDWELLVFTWPRIAVPLPDAETQSLTARCLSGDDGLGAIIGGMLRGLAAAPPRLSSDGAARLSREIAELVTTAAAEQTRMTEPGRSSRDLVGTIDRYIVERLADPHLGPAEIADAHFISVRHLHRLFAGRGCTVAQQIQQLRLERARLDLRHPGGAGRSVTEIARAWGFTDLPGFSRAFRTAYGTTPTGFRSEHLGRPNVVAPEQGPRDARLPIGQHAAEDWPVHTTDAAPLVRPERWTLTVDGLIRHPRTWTWDDLHQLPQSTYQGDIHAGTTWSKLGTRFGGVSLDVLLELADPLAHAAFVLATSSTGYTTNLPLDHVTGGRAWIVWTYDGKPLPREHGGPARLLVPHLYLWKSAKWITRLTLLEHDQPGFRELNGYHSLGDPWREQRYQGD